MPGLTYPSQETVSGVWLLDKEALQKLDEIADACWEKLQESRDAAIEREYRKRRRAAAKESHFQALSKVEKRQRSKAIRDQIADSYSMRTQKREIEIKFPSGKKLTVEKFGDVENLPVVQSETADGFVLSLTCGSNRVTVSPNPGALSACKLPLFAESSCLHQEGVYA